MNELAARFEESRPRLRRMAYRILGSSDEAEDAVQETWLRLSRSDSGAVENLDGWLTTVLSRVCLDLLRSRASRREDPLLDAEPVAAALDPEREAVLADSVGLAMLVVLDTLEPAERLAFVLHDLFAVPFEEIARVVGRTPAAARQLASRARRRLQGPPLSAPDRSRQREVVAAFLAASRDGDFAALLALLDPDVVLRTDAVGAAMGAEAEVRGADAVARTFAGRAQAARLALVDGMPGAAWLAGGAPRVVFDFTVLDGAVVAIELIADPEMLGALELELLER
jgi:RNA polymerase sigma factor (sigma-70 family)